MKVNNILFLLVFGSIMSVFASCKSENIDKTSPEIIVYEPVEGGTVSASTDSVHVEFHVADNIEIHEVLAVITDSIGNVLWQDGLDVDKKELQYHDHYIPSGVTSTQHLKFTVTASDHSENTSKKEVSFYVAP